MNKALVLIFFLAILVGLSGCIRMIQTHCGDGICGFDETYENCRTDCYVCGDGECSPHERELTCPQDCKPKSEGAIEKYNACNSDEECTRILHKKTYRYYGGSSASGLSTSYGCTYAAINREHEEFLLENSDPDISTGCDIDYPFYNTYFRIAECAENKCQLTKSKPEGTHNCNKEVYSYNFEALSTEGLYGPFTIGFLSHGEKEHLLQIDNSSDFSSPLVEKRLESEVRNERVSLDSGTYYWRVKDEDSQLWSDACQVRVAMQNQDMPSVTVNKHEYYIGEPIDINFVNGNTPLRYCATWEWLIEKLESDYYSDTLENGDDAVWRELDLKRKGFEPYILDIPPETRFSTTAEERWSEEKAGDWRRIMLEPGIYRAGFRYLPNTVSRLRPVAICREEPYTGKEDPIIQKVYSNEFTVRIKYPGSDNKITSGDYAHGFRCREDQVEIVSEEWLYPCNEGEANCWHGCRFSELEEEPRIYCSNCGNGICEEGENRCNCIQDCEVKGYQCYTYTRKYSAEYAMNYEVKVGEEIIEKCATCGDDKCEEYEEPGWNVSAVCLEDRYCKRSPITGGLTCFEDCYFRGSARERDYFVDKRGRLDYGINSFLFCTKETNYPNYTICTTWWANNYKN